LAGVAWPLVFKIFVARKLLPSRCFAPALDHILVALVEFMLEVQQRHHQTGGQTRSPGIGEATTGNGRDRAKQIQVFDLLARLDLAPSAAQGSLDLLPRHAIGHHRQRIAQIDHLVQAVGQKVIVHGGAFKDSQKTGVIGYLIESFDHPDSPHFTSVHAGCRGFTGATNK
jgi:hypothetical protein